MGTLDGFSYNLRKNGYFFLTKEGLPKLSAWGSKGGDYPQRVSFATGTKVSSEGGDYVLKTSLEGVHVANGRYRTVTLIDNQTDLNIRLMKSSKVCYKAT